MTNTIAGGSVWAGLEGQVVGNYRLREWLGAGGSGATYAAELAVPGQQALHVAVKLIPIEEIRPEHQVKWLSALNLRHPHLAGVQDVGTCQLGGQRYFYQVSELADRSLADELRSGPLTPERAHSLVRHVAAGMQYLHDQGMVHGDLSPANILWSGSGWKIADYSQQRSVRLAETHATGSLPARNPYAPPEAYLGTIEPAWDVWSLGVILTEALTRRGTWQQEGLAHRHLARSRSLPEPFEAIVAACLLPDPGQRPTAKQILQDLPELPRPSPTLRPERVAVPVPGPEAVGGDLFRGPVSAAAPPTVTRRPATAPPTTKPATPRAQRDRLWLLVPALLLMLAGIGYWAGEARSEVADPGITTAPARQSPVVVPTPMPEATRGAGPPIALPDPTLERRPPPPASVTAPRPVPPGASRAQNEAAIREVVSQWQRTTQQRDVKAHLATYGPQMDVFYRQRGVSRANVEREKTRLFRDFTDIRIYDIKNLRFESLEAGRAVVTFDKEWDTAGRTRFAGAGRSRLRLRQMDGLWRIVGEEDIRVYWSRRS